LIAGNFFTMPERKRASRLRLLLLLVSLASVPVTPAADAAAPVSRSQNLTLNLIRRLVQRGVLPQSDADDLIRLAEEDTAAAKAGAAAAPAVLAATPPPAAGETVRVTYVPEFLKKQMREEVKQDVLAQARAERWAAPRSFPEWVSRYTLFGDLRLRGEGLFYPAGNDNTGAFPNFNAINAGSPFDVAGTVFSPQNNVDRDRQRERIRVRLGADIDLGEGYTVGVRLATGENNSPVTTNQSLGASGGFNKYAVWLDRAFVKYHAGNLTVTAGRFDNPFFATPMIFDDDLGFDGLAAAAKFARGDNLKPFATLGAFPVFNSSLNFSSIQPAKFKSQDKYLLGGQVGSDVQLTKDLSAKVGAAYYYYQNIAGKLSSPFTPVNGLDNGDTDETRPAFAQTGNTYFPLRNIVPNVLNNFGTINQFQYFGLATPFREVALSGRIDYNRLEPVQLSLLGEWVNNLAYHRGAIRKVAVNNLGAGGAGDFAGGQNGWNFEFKVGSIALTQRGDWSASLGYRYLESDAVVDGFTDSDFGNGGTNLEGFALGGTYALSRRTWVALRWLSASNIAGPRYRNDILQFDFNGKF
jgi:hypothetical protein